jgi:hypothetical protein
VALPRLEIGQMQTCNDVTRNLGTLALAGLEIHHVLLHIATGQVVSDQVYTLDLGSGLSNTHARSILTESLPAGDYACVLQTRVNAELRTLAYGAFQLVEPPVKIDSQLRLGSRGRLLVLLDDAKRCEQPVETARTLGGDAKSSSPSDQGQNCDPDPHGPRSAEGLRAQRAYLEALLTQAGWSYTITETAADFTRELRTGGYRLYALFSEQEKLAEEVQKELREAVYRGEGLLVGGGHDARHHGLDDSLGIDYRGKESHTVGMTLADSPLRLTGNVLLAYEHVPRVDPTTAAVAGVYDLDPARYAGYCEANAKGGQGAAKCLPKAVVTFNVYGQGHSVFAGFDLLAEAVRLGDDSLLATLVLNGLEAVNPVSPSLAQGGVVPVTLTLENPGIATPVHVTVTLPAGLVLVDAGGATPSGANPETLTWDLSLAEAQSANLTIYVRLPASTEPQTIAALIEAPVAGTFKTFGNPTLVLTPEPAADGAVARAMLQALIDAGTADRNRLRQARQHLEQAERYLADDPGKAVNELLKATDALMATNLIETGPIRLELDRWIRAVEMQIGPPG